MVGVQCKGHPVETAPSEEQELCKNTAALMEVLKNKKNVDCCASG